MRRACWWLLGAALVMGALSDRTPARAPLRVGPFRVLAVDLHVHTFPLSASTLAPWDVVLEARRQGLDAIAISGQNEAISGKVARWFSRLVGGPTVIASEEVHGPAFHLIAAGIDRTVSWRLSAEDAIDEIHRQGGIAIAAHPTAGAWPAFSRRALQDLDAAEVAQPVAFSPGNAKDVREFSRRTGAAAIGSSDWHGMGPVGLCRTYVFAQDDSAAAILAAIRARQTVVVDRGRVFGNMILAQMAGDRLFDRGTPAEASAWGWLRIASGVCGVAGLLALALFSLPKESFRRDPPPARRKASAGA
ncbi:MAG TPA: PHP-associated domain-containing protein [Candidatus Acidoferrum sp.]|nr:PHP-associated domain-containing protein [Candidatus Acidoferrum sp.]